MSRVCKEKIDIKKLTKHSMENGSFIVEGPLGVNKIIIPSFLSLKVEEGVLSVDFLPGESREKTKEEASMHGTVVRLIKNGVLGVTLGFKKVFLFKGLGYKCSLGANNVLTMSLGHSHPEIYKVPSIIKLVSGKPDRLEATCYNKEELGQFAAKLKKINPWNPYSSKGILEEGTTPYTKAVVKTKK